MVVIVLIALLAGMIFLQIFLSQKQNKWLGRILPIITFSFSIMTSFITLFAFIARAEIWILGAYFVLSFLLWNIPTIILYAIYKSCREKMNRNTQV